MKSSNSSNPSTPVPSIANPILVRGIHLDLTPALRQATEYKVARLFRHETRIDRIRIDIEHDKTRAHGEMFIVKAQIEIAGPDLVASVSSDDAYKSLDLLVDKLDQMLRKRHNHFKERRHRSRLSEHDVELTKA